MQTILLKFHCTDSKLYWVVSLSSMDLYAFLTILEHTPQETMVSWGSPPRSGQGHLSFWRVWAAAWQLQMERSIMSQLDFGQASVGTSQWYQFLNPPGTACILSPHEARHCHTRRNPGPTGTSVGSDNGWQTLETVLANLTIARIELAT